MKSQEEISDVDKIIENLGKHIEENGIDIY